MKRVITTVLYLLGWIYPISTIIVNLSGVRTDLMGMFDFGNDSIIFWLFYGTVFAVVTFVVYFAYFYNKYDIKKNIFYFTFINVFLYYPSISCNLYYSNSWEEAIPATILVADLLVIAFTLLTAPRKADKI